VEVEVEVDWLEVGWRKVERECREDLNG
jgi:hypothetical protein